MLGEDQNIDWTVAMADPFCDPLQSHEKAGSSPRGCGGTLPQVPH